MVGRNGLFSGYKSQRTKGKGRRNHKEEKKRQTREKEKLGDGRRKKEQNWKKTEPGKSKICASVSSKRNRGARRRSLVSQRRP